MKKTPWFSCAVNPARVGHYETQLRWGWKWGRVAPAGEAYWNGSKWSRALFGQVQLDRWRGLTTKNGK